MVGLEVSWMQGKDSEWYFMTAMLTGAVVLARWMVWSVILTMNQLSSNIAGPISPLYSIIATIGVV